MSELAFGWPARVYYEDTDASGVVYHARYLHFFERARTEWLRHLGLSQQKLRDQDGVVFTVAGIEVEFLWPARLDDCLRVTVGVEQRRRASLVFSQELLREGAPELLLARARVRVGCVNAASFRPCALPESFSTVRFLGVPA